MAGVTDQRAGSLLIPLVTRFRTSTTGSRQPAIASVSPGWLPLSGGTLTVSGLQLQGVTSATVGGIPANITAAAATELTLTIGPRAMAGPQGLSVTDVSGLFAAREGAVYFVDTLAGPTVIAPDHGPTAGGTRVAVTFQNRKPLVAGTRVFVGGKAADAVDVVDASHLRFTVPVADDSGLASITIERPGAPAENLGLFAYDAAVGDRVTFPGYPPRRVSELEIRGNTWFLASDAAPWGLDVFDVTVVERPLRLGSLVTDGPAHGLAVRDELAFIAADSAGVSVVDVSSPAAPFEVARLLPGSISTDVLVTGDELWVSTSDPSILPGAVSRYEATSGNFDSRPVILLDADPLSIDTNAGGLFALTSDVQGLTANGLSLVSYTRAGVRRGEILVASGALPFAERVRSRLRVLGNLAYVSSGDRVWIYDVTSDTPALVRTAALGAEASGLAEVGGALWVAQAGSARALPPAEFLLTSLEPAGALATPDAVIVATFNLPVAPTSITDSTFSVTTGGVAVAGSRVLDFTTTGARIRFTPTAPLTPGSIVRVEIDGLLDFDGRALRQPVDHSFTVAPADAMQPQLGTIQPRSGRADLSTVATISGTGFRTGTSVEVGGLNAQVLSASATELVVLVPPSAQQTAGPATVTVLDPSGLSAIRVGGFVYREPLRLSSLSPETAPQAGGVSVLLRGRGFTPGMAVNFGGTDSFSVSVQSTTSATAIAPPHGSGRVSVVLRANGETFSLPDSFLYGSGAVARFETGAVADLIVEDSLAYVAFGGSTAITNADGTVYSASATSSGNSVGVLDLSEPNSLRFVKDVPLPQPGGARRLVKAGSTLWVAAAGSGLVAIDVALPAQAGVSGSVSTIGDAVDVVVSGRLGFVADSAGVLVVDLERRTAAGRIAVAGGAGALALADGTLFIASASASSPTLQLRDVRNASWTLLSTTPMAAPARDLAVEGERVFAALGHAGQVAIYDVTSLVSPAPLATIQLADPLGAGWVSAEQVNVIGTQLLVAAGGGDVQRWSVPRGSAPSLVETIPVFGDVRALAISRRSLFAGTLWLVDQSVPRELPLSAVPSGPSVVGSVSTVALDALPLLSAFPGENQRLALTELPELQRGRIAQRGPARRCSAGVGWFHRLHQPERRVHRHRSADPSHPGRAAEPFGHLRRASPRDVPGAVWGHHGRGLVSEIQDGHHGVPRAAGDDGHLPGRRPRGGWLGAGHRRHRLWAEHPSGNRRHPRACPCGVPHGHAADCQRPVGADRRRGDRSHQSQRTPRTAPGGPALPACAPPRQHHARNRALRIQDEGPGPRTGPLLRHPRYFRRTLGSQRGGAARRLPRGRSPGRRRGYG